MKRRGIPRYGLRVLGQNVSGRLSSSTVELPTSIMLRVPFVLGLGRRSVGRVARINALEVMFLVIC